MIRLINFAFIIFLNISISRAEIIKRLKLLETIDPVKRQLKYMEILKLTKTIPKELDQILNNL